MRKQRAERLRFAVNTLPPETRRAMLDGIERNRIVTGANTDRRGGVCPMLAADRESFNITPLADIFATAWDRYTGTSFVNVTRRTASDRDLNVLRSMLQTSLELNPGTATELAQAVREIRAEVEPAAVQAVHPDLLETSRALTAAARLEVMRALEATGHAPRQPFLRAAPNVTARPAAASDPAPRIQAAPPRPPAARVEAARYGARVESSPAAPAPAAAPECRAPAANRTRTEIDRERARAIIANQASTLRSRAWPRPAEPVEEQVVPTPAPAPAAVPVAAGVPAPALQLGDRDRTRELQSAAGWAWLRPFSTYEDYQRTLQDLGEMQRGPAGDTPADDGGHRRAVRRPEPTPA